MTRESKMLIGYRYVYYVCVADMRFA